MTLTASLPMYDRPEIRGATDRFWLAIREIIGEGPNGLLRGDPLWKDIWAHWRDPGLILSQTCGYPYRARLHGHVGLVGTPDFGLPGCPPGYYYSVFVVRADDPRDDLADFAQARFAYNEPLSQSGWAAPQNHTASQGFTFVNTLETGGHGASALAVAEDRADCAALDVHSWNLMQRFDAFAAKLRVIGRTDPTPGLPLITALGLDTDKIFDAVGKAIETLASQDRKDLGISGLSRIPAQAYLKVPNPAPPTE